MGQQLMLLMTPPPIRGHLPIAGSAMGRQKKESVRPTHGSCRGVVGGRKDMFLRGSP